MDNSTQPGGFDPSTDSDGPSVCISSLVPRRLADLVRKEARRLMVSNSQIVRWALAERYTPPHAKDEHD